MKNEISRGAEVYSEDVFQVLIDYEISRSIRYPTPLGMLQIQITHTPMNEKTILVASTVFTTALNGHLRSVDIPSGKRNNYKVLLPTTTESGLRTVCERLLSIFRNKFNTPDGNSIAFSLNIGGASHPGGESLSRVLLQEKSETSLKQSLLKGPNTYSIIL
jgi:hypothetical protein